MIHFVRTVVIICVLFTSCQKEKSIMANEKNAIKKEQLVVNLKEASINIEGMTCEIGCARIIQSKLSKAKGVRTAKVDFKAKTGIVEYDANMITQKQIVSIVEQIGGGDLYKITKINVKE